MKNNQIKNLSNSYLSTLPLTLCEESNGNFTCIKPLSNDNAIVKINEIDQLIQQIYKCFNDLNKIKTEVIQNDMIINQLGELIGLIYPFFLNES